MKNVLLVAALSLASVSFAQKIGVKAGLNVASLRILNNNTENHETVNGMYAGLLANFPVTVKFSIQPELVYSQDGGRYSILKMVDVPIRTISEIKLQTISLPVMFQYRPISRLYVEVGPEFSVIAGKDEKVTTLAGQITTEVVSNTIKDQLKNFNFGFGAGVGVDVIAGLGVNLRYVAGAANISESTVLNNIKSNHFQMGVTYKF